jgi:uncharacterized protein YdcH (DUF465 family)
MVGTAREGQYSFMTRFSRTLRFGASKAESLPEAIRTVEGNPVEGDDSEMQRPVSSTQTARGWRRDDRTTPRRVLIIQGGHKEESDQKGIATDTEHYRKLAEEYGVLPENITIVKAGSKADVIREMEKMKAFSDQHPGAEAMVALVGHGWGSTESGRHEPGLSAAQIQQEGAGVGNFWLGGDTHLMESDMKAYFQQYMTGYKSVIGIANSCSSGAWIADNRRLALGEANLT